MQIPEGSVTLQFENDNKLEFLPSKLDKLRSSYSHISPLDYIVEQSFTSSRVSTSQIREKTRSEFLDEDKIEKIIINKDNIVRGIRNNVLNTKDANITESEMGFENI